MYLKKDLLLNTNLYDIYFIELSIHLKKNILYLKRCGYVFSSLVVDRTYVIKLLGLLISSWIRFIYIVDGYWHSVESNWLISSLWSWFNYYLCQIYMERYKYGKKCFFSIVGKSCDSFVQLTFIFYSFMLLVLIWFMCLIFLS